MNKQNERGVFSPLQGCGAAGKGGIQALRLQSQLHALHLCRAVELVLVGSGEGEQNKPEKNPSERLSSPFSVNGRDGSLWELQWGMGLAEGVGRSRAQALQSSAALVLLSFSALTGGCEAHVAGNGMGEAEQDHSLAFVLSPQG